MLRIHPQDDNLSALEGCELPSEIAAGVSYRIGKQLGAGGMAVAFLAHRVSADGECIVVLKIVRPWLAIEWAETAQLVVQKEAVALGRLNERVPPCPFVVKLIDTGSAPVEYMRRTLALPWVVLEYVHGGVEGTTLRDRVAHSVRTTNFAFDPARAANAVACLAGGLSAVHEVGVIHRDFKPDNVLACGFGADEIFKIADFGVAKPRGVEATFGKQLVGTLGYAAPEALAYDERHFGPWTDIYAFAAVVFFLLTGEEYFPAHSPAEAILAGQTTKRRSILEVAALHPEIRVRDVAWKAIDAALAQATSIRADARPQSAQVMAAMLLPSLRHDSRRPKEQARRLSSFLDRFGPTPIGSWSWTTLHHGSGERRIRSVAWDGDGCCMAATDRGLSFWDGVRWIDRAPEGVGVGRPESIRFVRRMSAGRWLVGGEGGVIALWSQGAAVEVIQSTDPGLRMDLLSGDLDDLAIVVGHRQAGPPVLHALVARRWLRPLELPLVERVSAVARVDDVTWLLAGRSIDGSGLAAVYSPLDWTVEPIDTEGVGAFVAAVGHADRKVGLAVGSGGAVVWYEEGRVVNEVVEPGAGYDLTAAGVDLAGRGWAAGAGKVWLRAGKGTPERVEMVWERVWENEGWTSPFVSIFADYGVVVAMTADGGIIQGRAGSGGPSDARKR